MLYANHAITAWKRKLKIDCKECGKWHSLHQTPIQFSELCLLKCMCKTTVLGISMQMSITFYFSKFRVQTYFIVSFCMWDTCYAQQYLVAISPKVYTFGAAYIPHNYSAGTGSFWIDFTQ